MRIVVSLLIESKLASFSREAYDFILSIFLSVFRSLFIYFLVGLPPTRCKGRGSFITPDQTKRTHTRAVGLL
jgi:hypothetical protein